MSKTKPETVDANAWWSASDNEWVLGPKDDNDKFHGLVTYWRPDGTLVNHCNYEHGTPHGVYKRYHECGEISRQGTFVQGKLQGTDVFLRTETETTENFPHGLSADVWRAEMDMVNGSMVAGRLYNKEGQQVGEDGVPCPDRPSEVPEEAVYSSTSGRWVLGSTNDSYEREGTWTFFTQDGWIQQQIEYSAGEIQSDTRYYNRYASTAALRLRDADFAGCMDAIDAGMAELEDDVEQLCLLALRVECQAEEGDAAGAVKTASEALESFPIGLHWGRFMTQGQRGYNATAELEAHLALHYLGEDRGEEALRKIRDAIDHTTRAQARYYAIKADALAMLGRTDEQLASIKAALSIDADAPEVAQYKDDPNFSEWLKAIDPDSMTVEGAWAILGDAGTRLEQYQGVLVDDEDEDDEDDEDADEDDEDADEDDERARQVFDPETMDICLDHPFDLGSLPSCSAELQRFSQLASTIDLHDYRGENASGCESTLTAAVETIDGNWLARIQSIFLPASIVNIDDESMQLASWHPTAHQTSRIYSIHQDEAEFYHRGESLSAMIAGNLELDDEDTETTISERTKNQWLAAAEATSTYEAFPAPFELLLLEPRTHWIVNLLVGKNPDIISEIFLGKGIATAATNEDWEAEREHLQWPHLQAYWLFHHAVFGNHTLLAEVLEHANLRYPAVSELSIFAKQLLAGEDIEEEFWNLDRVQEYRMQALEERPDLLSDDAKAQLMSDNQAVFEADATIGAALEELGEDPENEGLVGFLGVLRECAGTLDGSQESLSRHLEKPMDYFMSMKKGRVTPFEDLYRRLDILPQRITEKPEREKPLRKLFEAAIARSAESPDDHSNTMPGALYGLGILTIEDAAGFDAFLKRVEGFGFYPEKFGRFRRLELAMLATPHFETSQAAQTFLRTEAARFAEQSEGWKTDTFDYADRMLAELGDEAQLVAINERFCGASFSGSNWTESIDIARRFLEKPSPLMKEGLKAAVEKGLGRHDDGERAIVVRAYAKCAGPEARAEILGWLGSIEDVRTECETAALLAGLIELDVGSDAIAETTERARAVLATLTKGSMKVGAAISLLQTIHAHGISGFAAEAKSLAKSAEAEKYTEDALKEWMAEHVESFAS